ncbi:MAG: LacI family DNA-binding transcriptional regulator [Armatimonadota bacterium]
MSDNRQPQNLITRTTGTVVTQRDIAERCGMHQTTVSLALRKDPRIAGSTIDHVLAVAAEMGYDSSLHTTARRLAMRRHGHDIINNVIGLSMRSGFIHMHYYAAIFQGIVDVLMPEEFSLVLTDLHYPDEVKAQAPLPTIFNRGDVDGLIFYLDYPSFKPHITRLRETPGFGDRPMVSLVYAYEECSAVLTDDGLGAYLATQHLIELGHRHLLHLCTTRDELRCGQARRWHGVRRALSEHGLDPAQHLRFFEIDTGWMNPLWTPEENDNAFVEFMGDKCHPLVQELEAHPEITAILAANDSSALQSWYVLNHAGIRVPDDISIIGFDDVDSMLDDRGQNQLTSVRLPLAEVGREAAQLMMQQVSSGSTERVEIMLPTQLIIRRSASEARTR